ncbi:hypothetical protein FALBO_2446 [Fusarium albosuccineum]|uniref:Uncharacterized protein n=1 Tax=Fusarium albosuccineum TaxID=1237068 RepID=A0A8H4PHU2_9HYPO|nr:hypothetical protein FALBO_2446 [Fusarium albosuccineum]
MCRMVVFEGMCTRCGIPQTWTDLTQELSCLEAKNKGWFGECARGIYVEEHTFDQECSTCAEEDEGIGDLDHEKQLAASLQHTMYAQSNPGKRRAAQAEDRGETSSERKKQRT